ncbi:phenylalanine--tRNA ligase subunit alpha [Candidatus Parcubacteria bacterium]|nr:phenylalanine--tRNA ligase subunit alpha [Candidatus Parcubacteria bacterium]
MTENTDKGHLHPLTIVIRDIYIIFAELGFSVALGPELETEYYNFDALNIPANHPARSMQDTFWIKDTERKVLRTQTSPVQIRFMETHKPPFKMIAPGRVFRNEATDSTHEVQFFQVEGLAIDKKISMAELKGTLEYFFKKLLGHDVQLRFRPSFFPFTEPSVEVDIFFRGKWLEVMGAGMVHPKVLETGGIDPQKWRGFAFGVGIDRLAMIKYGIDDVRRFYNGDLRLVNQF